MTRNYLLLAVVVLFTMLTQWSCQPTQYEAIKPTAQDISIAEAQHWLTAQQASARLRADEHKNAPEVYWKLAQKHQLTDGRVAIVVPLTYQYQPVLASSVKVSDMASLDKEGLFIQSKLLVYKDKEGIMQSDLVQIIPTEEDRKKSKRVKASSFSGTVLVSGGLGGVPTAGYVYKDGKLTGSFKPSATQGARLSNTRCGVYLYYLHGTAPEDLTVEHTTRDASGQVFDAVFIAASCESEGGGGFNGGGNGGGGGGYFDDNGELTSSQAYNFLYYMQNQRDPAIAFNNDEQTLVRQNPKIIVSLSVYINQYGQKPDLSAFTVDVNTASDQQMISAINKLVNDPGVPTGMTSQELSLLGLGTSSFRANLNKYYYDAREASWRAIINYTSYEQAVERSASIANAFKHSLLAILHARTFGRSRAQQIANAHEEYDVNRSPTEYSVEIQMDLWNNQEGFNIFDANPS